MTKTHVGDCGKPGQGFEFVVPEARVFDTCRRRASSTRAGGARLRHDGYRFEAGRRVAPRALRHDVRKKSLDKLKDSIREKTRRTRGVSLAQVIAELNPVLRGWFGYFKQAFYTTFRDLDGFVRRRLRSMLMKHQKRSHIGFGHVLHRIWPNACFANAGLFALHTAWQSAKRSR